MKKLYWIVGHPLSFCLTTPVMNGAFEEEGIDAQFETHDVPPDEFPAVMERLKKGELAGIIATMPYKTPSIEHLDVSSPEVKDINAVNVLVNKDGKVHGYNTDWEGAIGAIKTKIPDVKDLSVLVLGAGGAARAAAYGLKKEGARVAIWNRSKERAKSFAEEMDLEWVEHLDGWNGQPDIIVNATAASDANRQSTLVPFYLWKNVKLALDAVYGKTSLFLEEAKALNVPHVISGEIWFLKQVFPMHKLFTGKEGPMDLMTRLTHESKEIARS